MIHKLSTQELAAFERLGSDHGVVIKFLRTEYEDLKDRLVVAPADTVALLQGYCSALRDILEAVDNAKIRG